MSFYEKTYEEAYSKGYLDGYDRSRTERPRDGGRAGWICMCAAIWAMAAFAIVASVLEIFHLA